MRREAPKGADVPKESGLHIIVVVLGALSAACTVGGSAIHGEKVLRRWYKRHQAKKKVAKAMPPPVPHEDTDNASFSPEEKEEKDAQHPPEQQ